MHVLARDIMTRKVVSVRADATLTQAAHTLAARAFSVLPVVNSDGAPVGIVSDTDLMRALLADRAASGPVSGVTTSPVEVVDELDTVDDVMLLMRTRGVHHVPVVRGGKLAGMITPGDIVRWFVAHPFAIGLASA